MAWAFQAIGVPVVVSDGSGVVPVSAVSGITAGDDLFIFVSARPESGVAGSWTTPSGWTLVAAMNPEGTSCGGALYWKKASGGETTTNVTCTATSLNLAGVMFRYTGGPASGLTAHASNKSYELGVQDIAVPAVTITQPNCLVLFVASRNNNSDSAGVTTWPAGAVTRLAFGSSIGFAELSLIIGGVVQTTATNISAGSIDMASATALANNILVVAMEPAGAGSTLLWPQYTPRFNPLVRM